VDIASHSPRIHPAYQQSWPTHQHQEGCVTIQYVAGYAAVPEGVKTAIKMLAGLYWNQRSRVDEVVKNDTIETAHFLLQPYRAFAAG
jgi:hypothetical protein